MPVPARPRRLSGRHALVDGIQFEMPAHSEHSPARTAAFPGDAQKAAARMPGGENHPFRMPDGRALNSSRGAMPTRTAPFAPAPRKASPSPQPPP